MARGFGAGVLWGVVVAGAGLIVLSQMAPPPRATLTPGDTLAAPEEPAQPEVAETTAADKATADKAASDKVAADKAAADKAAADKVAADKAAADKAAADKAAADKAAADKVAADKAAADKKAAEAAEQLALATEAPLVAEVAVVPDVPPLASPDSPAVPFAEEVADAPDLPADEGDVPSLTGLDQALTVPAVEPEPAEAEPAPAQPDGPQDALSLPGQPAGQDEVQRLPQIAPAPDLDVAAEAPAMVPEPATDKEPEQSPAATLRDDQPTLPPVKPLADKLPTTVVDKVVPGVKVGDLPQIGAKPASEAEAAAEVPPIRRFARNFTPEGKPLFVILLHDLGAAGMARDELVKLPFPVSFVVDPLAPDARDAMAAYRAAGQEVLTLANGIPQGAQASDLETTFATLSSILPDSVALVDQDLGGFQDQRPLAALVLPVIKGEGRGLVTYDRGLNAADQIARREGVPAATIFRRLDGEGESIPTIRRYLDRAAFKAAQEGAVVVIGDTREATVAAILEWMVEGRAGTVTLAPVTAVMK